MPAIPATGGLTLSLGASATVARRLGGSITDGGPAGLFHAAATFWTRRAIAVLIAAPIGSISVSADCSGAIDRYRVPDGSGLPRCSGRMGARLRGRHGTLPLCSVPQPQGI